MPFTNVQKTMQIWPPEKRTDPVETVAAPPPWLLGTWAGAVGGDKWGGSKGYWNERIPPLAHMVGGPDKDKNIKAHGWFHYDSEVLASIVAKALVAIPWQAPQSIAPQVINTALDVISIPYDR